MPLFRKQPLQTVTNVDRLRDDAKVFYAELTGKIFTNYEDYFHHVMLLSSMSWSCALTGKQNLTYLEALESERATRKLQKIFPDAVKGPLLMVARHTKRTAINEMVGDVYSFIKDQFFTGEEVKALDPVNNKIHQAIVMKVEPVDSCSGKREPSNLMYHVMAKDFTVPKLWVVPWQMMRRNRSSLTHEKCKIFLRQHIEKGPGGLWRVKLKSLDRYVRDRGLKDEQLFFGYGPEFKLSKKMKRKAEANGKAQGNEASTLTVSAGCDTVPPPAKKKRQHIPGKDKTVSRGNNDVKDLVEQSQENVVLEKITKTKNTERMNQKAEQEAAAKKNQEERKALLAKLVTLAMKKYNSVFDDQTLEDQRVMPPVRPVRTLIPAKYFGNFVFILEFLNSFADLLSSPSTKFPNGFTMDLLEDALLQHEMNGPLGDIFQMLLRAIFSHQTEEENEVDVSYGIPENIALKRETVPDQVRARDAAIWVQKHYRSKVHELPLNYTTVSEVLRLHILASGALVEERTAKHRHLNRGGFINSDDPGLRLVQDYPHILRTLKSYPVFQLPIGDVIQLLCCLIHQLLTYSGVRKLVEERVERARLAHSDYQANWAAQRRITNKVGKLKNIAREKFKNDLSANEGGGEGSETEAAHLDSEFIKIEADVKRQLLELNAKAKKLKEDCFNYQIYLGTDRCYRSYWLFQSLPGLFVEHDQTAVGECGDRATVNNAKLANCPSEMRRKYITKSIMTAGMSVSFLQRFTAGSLPDESVLYEQLLAEGSAMLHQHDVIDAPSHHPSNHELLMCTAKPDSCPVHGEKEGPSWGYYASAEELDALILSLNVRGWREKQLRETLQCKRDLIVSHIANCPTGKLSVTADTNREQLLAEIVARQQSKYDSPNIAYEQGTEPNDIMEELLVVNLLKLEQKITVGNMGVMRVRDRQKWRNAIEAHSYDAQTNEPLVWGPKWLTNLGYHQNGDGQEQERQQNQRQEDKELLLSHAKDPGYHLPDTTVSLMGDSIFCDDNDALVYPLHESETLQARVYALASALLQIEQCIEQKFLGHPFRPKRKHSDRHLMQQKQLQGLKNRTSWEVSLMRSSSYAQLFLHYAVLYNAIHWTRSAKRVRCMVCHRKGDPDLTVLCDECNLAYHIYCLKPKLRQVPAGDWFCVHCRPASKKKNIFKWEDDDGAGVEQGFDNGVKEPEKEQ